MWSSPTRQVVDVLETQWRVDSVLHVMSQVRLLRFADSRERPQGSSWRSLHLTPPRAPLAWSHEGSAQRQLDGMVRSAPRDQARALLPSPLEPATGSLDL